MINRIPVHLYVPYSQQFDSEYGELDALWLEVRTREEWEILKRTRPGAPVIPVIKDPSLIGGCLSDAQGGVAVPLQFKDELLRYVHRTAGMQTPIFLIEEEFRNTRSEQEVTASLNRIKSAIVEIKKAGIRDLAVDLFHPDPVVYFKSNQHLKKEPGLSHVISLVPLPDRMQSIVRNTLAISALFYQQTGSVLLIRPPNKEQARPAIELGRNILANLNLYGRTHRVISCPGCGRCQWDLEPMSRRIKAELDEIVESYSSRRKKLEECGGIAVAVMGCNVNGPGEARDADIGVAGGKNRTGTIFKMGKPFKTVREDEIFSEMAKGIREVIEKKIK